MDHARPSEETSVGVLEDLRFKPRSRLAEFPQHVQELVFQPPTLRARAPDRQGMQQLDERDAVLEACQVLQVVPGIAFRVQ